ncbi:Ribulose-phosphate 3-epimerase [Candidatus Providencia siddallii]|uniref:Ribulose-phosphate 3-epimerase n=1 Tax=Candidatus Providencia siddallii TaxID=1715285 RepID=A0A0M6W829_9GAMM|nr:Ribulose-phosphate 3-epimerase [Candidatus Providencia siddallii]
MKNFIIAPSILSANFACLGEDIKKVIKAGADMIHFDVMDNHFVPNLTFGALICKSLNDYGISVPIDVHLMVKPVDRIIPDFAKAGAKHISIHPEASNNVKKSLELIIEHGCTTGLALNPMTPLSCLDNIMDKVNTILVMSVNPGFANQLFIPQTLNKLRKLRKLINNSGYKINLEVDGGVKINNIASIGIAGADIFVIGSEIFNHVNYKSVINLIRDKLKKNIL